MPIYSIAVSGVSTGTTAGTYATLVGVKFPNTTGFKGRLRKLIVSGGGGAAQDLQVDIRVDRSDNTSDGTSTAVSTALIAKQDSLSVASNVSAIGKTYTVEPTTFVGAQGIGGSLNTRGVLLLEWADGKGPVWGINQTLCVKGTIGTGITAATLTVGLEWEE